MGSPFLNIYLIKYIIYIRKSQVRLGIIFKHLIFTKPDISYDRIRSLVPINDAGMVRIFGMRIYFFVTSVMFYTVFKKSTA